MIIVRLIGGGYALIAGILYSIQLYTDFYACTSIAQGVSGLFGIDLIDNFARPYFATSIKDFWRRWHMSLSSWLRDYVYIPLGGNRKGTSRKYVNIAVTFFISGIWHGAGWNFLFWGLLHGFYQIAGDLLLPVRKKLRAIVHLDESRLYYRVLSQVVTFVLVTIGWIIFRANSLRTAIKMLLSIATVYNPWIFTNASIYNLGLDMRDFHILSISIVVLFVISILREKGIAIRKNVISWPLLGRWVFYLGIILFIVIFGTYGYGFDSQAFIYGGF